MKLTGFSRVVVFFLFNSYFCVNLQNLSRASVFFFQLDAQCSRNKEAILVADAFRIAFDQQLRKQNENFLFLTEANILKSYHEQAEGKCIINPVCDVRLKRIIRLSVCLSLLPPYCSQYVCLQNALYTL